MAFISTKVSPPPPRNYGQEGRDTLQAQIDMAPGQLAAEQQTRPAYAQLDLDILRRTLQGTPDAGAYGRSPEMQAIWDGMSQEAKDEYKQFSPENPQAAWAQDYFTNIGAARGDTLPTSGGFLDLERQATTSQRTGDIADVERLGGRAREAFRAANPQLTQIQDTLTSRALAGGDSALMGQLRGQAMGELQAGGSLTAGETRDVQQSARAAFNARGLARSDPGMFAEALNTSRYSNQRQADRRRFAMGVDSADLQRQQYGSNLLGTTGQFLSQTSSDPFQSILGRSATPTGALGAGFSLQSQPQIFNPFDPYAGSLYGSNQQNIMDARTATGANRSALLGAGIGALGMLGGGWAAGGFAKPCWVARSAYGVDNPRWLQFRAWLFGPAPRWLRALYLAHGERFAGWLDSHPRCKPAVRGIMDMILARAERRSEIGDRRSQNFQLPTSNFQLLS